MGNKYGYSVQPDPDTTSIASAREIPVKPRHVVNVCMAIRGMPLTKAKMYLEGVQELRVAVPFRRYKRTVKHRAGIGPGQYPVKAAGAVLRVIESAEANAEYKGLDPEKMFVAHAAAQKSAPIQGSMPRAQGRATPWNSSTCHIEVVLQERGERPGAPEAEPEAKAERKPARKPAKGKAKPQAAKGAKAKAERKSTKKKEES